MQLFVLAALLFAVLVGATTWNTVLGASGYRDKPSNRRELIEEQKVPRGLILARDGRTVLARSVPEGSGQRRTYVRRYPPGSLFSQPVGYSFLRNGRRSLEESRNGVLSGEEDEFESLLSQLEQRRREGLDVVTNLDVEGQRVATAALAGRKGAVVALEPKTGRVRVMVSTPSYDANRIPTDFAALNRDADKPLLNRSTQELYPPGSTFKVVTAAAALDSGEFTPQTFVDGSSPKTISGAPLANAGGQSFGAISLTDALTNSVNTVWAQVGLGLGGTTLVRYMDRFGFGADPKLDYPDDQLTASGIRNADGRLVRGDAGFDIGRVAIGQGGEEGQVLATPLQMALVAGTVANGGNLMKPRLTDRVVDADGRVREQIEPDLQNRVISRKAASELTAMMGRVVEEGTGTAAALAGIPVAGKTGTAEVGANREFTQPWFIGFAPLDDPKVAVAVTLERQPAGSSGGQTAGPIARDVIQTLLGGGG
ncbi:MAG: peptidoglycan D,D-transpeptidase FtsI family protein [Nocardioidaceae bacterium]